MTTVIDSSYANALAPITRRVRTDVTAVKMASGRQAWTRDALTPERLAKHCNGGPARGVCPIKAGESVTLVALLDFDSHGGEVGWPEMSAVVQRVASVLEIAWSAAPILWRSSGGRGVHLMLLWEHPQDAHSVRRWLSDVLAACGLRNGSGGVGVGQVEVFPKQDRVAADGFGNQFILPLAGASEPLVWDDMAECLVGLGREHSLTMAWPESDDAPLVAQAERAPVDMARAADAGAGSVWRAALDAIPNTSEQSLSYDDWRNVVFAIHHETEGSADGLALAHAFSARCAAKYDADFLDSRVWPYVRAGAERGAPSITGATIGLIAGRYGWMLPSTVPDPADWGVVDPETGLPAIEVASSPDSPQGLRDGTRSEGSHHEHDKDSGVAAEVKRRGVPAAQHLCTDQANANRMVGAYGTHLLVATTTWHAWTGARWEADEANVYQHACRLSVIVKEEARAIRARAADGLMD
jgi:hypothetical protein